jgi:hypothetical protein
MEPDDKTPQVPLIVVRIQASTSDEDEFAEQYFRFFGPELVFLPTEGLHPPGRRVKFLFALSDGRDAVCGEGVVLRMRRDTGDPARPAGMELRYQILDEDSQRVVDKMLALRSSGAARKPAPPPYVSMWLELPKKAEPANENANASAIRPSRAPLMVAFVAGLVASGIAFLVGGSLASMHGRARATIRMKLPIASMAQLGVGSGGANANENANANANEVSLLVTTRPPGARIRVDGQEVGPSPMEVKLAPGLHAIELERSRHRPFRIERRIYLRMPGPRLSR